IERGTIAAVDGSFHLELQDRTVSIPVPTYRMPNVPKLSAGYFAAPAMDLIDLFIGSEGTLGIVTGITLRVLSARPAFCLALISFDDRRRALGIVRTLRSAAIESWHTGGARGIDVSAIEYVDARCLQILREDGADRAHGVPIPSTASAALLVTIELPADTTADQAFDEIGRARDGSPPDTPLARFCGFLEQAAGLDDVEIAVPGDHTRAAQLLAIREAVPDGVNQRIGRARRDVDRRIEKVAADMIVPFDDIEKLLDAYKREFARRGF